MGGCMDKMDGYMDKWMDTWMDIWVDVWTKLMDEWINGQMDETSNKTAL